MSKRSAAVFREEVPYFIVTGKQDEEGTNIETGSISIERESEIVIFFHNKIASIMSETGTACAEYIGDYDTFWDNFYFNNSGGYGDDALSIKYFLQSEWKELEVNKNDKKKIYKLYADM